MAQNIQIVVYPVTNVEKAKAFYGAFLQAEPYVDSPYYVGYKVGDMEIGLDPHSTVGPIAYVDVADINSALQAMVDAGAGVVREPSNVGGGLVVAQVKDADGNVVGLRQGML